VSQENVAVVRSGIEAWNRHDAETWLSYAAPDVEWMPAGPAAVERAVYRGREEVASGFASVWETWEEFQLKEADVRDLGDSVLWLGHVKLKGSASHLELDQQFAVLTVLNAGKVISVQAFLEWSQALAAVGLEE
jgi:ketosteroid isomerase-like protein